jgi:RNA polymerase sigma-70 factor (sigma-E family)
VSVGGDHDARWGREGETATGAGRTGRGPSRPAAIGRARNRPPASLTPKPRPGLPAATATTAPDRAAPDRAAPDRAGAPDRAAEPRLEEPADIEFREFVISRGRSLLHSAYLLTGNLSDAEDLVQSALAKTYQAWDRIEDRKALDGYVRRAMVNTHISWWRRRKVDEYPTDDIPDQPVADASVTSELHDSLRRAIERLPQRMRAAVVLRFLEDMTEAEVADVLGVSQGTVKSTVSRAVAKLRTDRELLAE